MANPNPIERRKKIYELLKKEGWYDGDSFEDFEADYSSKEGQEELYNFVRKQKYYTNSFEDFTLDYYTDVNQEEINEKKKQGATPTKKDGTAGLETGLPEESPQKTVEEPLMNQDQAASILVNSPAPISQDALAELSIRMEAAFGNPEIFEKKKAELERKRDVDLQVLEDRKNAWDLTEGSNYEKMKAKVEKEYQKELGTITKAEQTDQALWNEGLKNPLFQALDNLNKMEFVPQEDKEVTAFNEKAWTDVKKIYDESFIPENEVDIDIYKAKLKQEGKSTEDIDALVKERFPQGEGDRMSMTIMPEARAIDILLDNSEYTDEQKSALRTYLTSRFGAEEKVKKVEDKVAATMEAIGMPSHLEFQKEASVISEIQKSVSNQVATFNGKFQAQAKVLDNAFEKKENTWKEQSKLEMEALVATYQEAVDNNQIKPEVANQHILKKQEELKAKYKAMVDDYTAKRAAIQTASANEYGKIKLINKDAQAKIDAFVEKYKLEDGELPEAYKERYEAIVGNAWEEASLTNKAKQDADWYEMGYPGRIGVSLAGGAMNLFESVFTGWKYFAPNSVVPDLSLQYMDEARSSMPSPDLGEEFSMKNLLNDSWWIKNAGEQLPIMIPMMGAGGLGFKGAMALAGSRGAANVVSRFVPGLLGKTGLNLQARQMIASFTGGAASRYVENKMEGNNAFRNALKEGKTYEEAMADLRQVENANMYLMATDAIQTYFTFAKGAKIKANPNQSGYLRQGLKNTFGYGGKMGVQVVTEGFEETWQEYSQAKLNNPYLTFGAFSNSDAGREIFWIGGAMGGATSAMFGGFSDRSAVGMMNKQIQDYYKLYDSKDISFEEIQNRSFQLYNTIETLSAQGVLTDKEIGKAKSILKHNEKVYKQVFDGTLPFKYDSKQLNEYSGLIWEHEQLRNKAEALDKKVPNEDTAVEKDLIKGQQDKIHERVMELVKNPKVSSYVVGNTALTKEEFESLVFDPANADALDEQMADTDDPEILSKMRAKGIQKNRFLGNATAFIDNNVEYNNDTGITEETVDAAIEIAQTEYNDLQEKADGLEESIGYPEAIQSAREAERNLEDLKYYKENMVPSSIEKTATLEGESTTAITDTTTVKEEGVAEGVVDEEVIVDIEPITETTPTTETTETKVEPTKERKEVIGVAVPNEQGKLNDKEVNLDETDENSMYEVFNPIDDAAEIDITRDPKKLDRMLGMPKDFMLGAIENLPKSSIKTGEDLLNNYEIIPGKVKKSGQGYEVTQKIKLVPKTTPTVEAKVEPVIETKVEPTTETKVEPVVEETAVTPTKLQEETTEAETPKNIQQDLSRGYRVVGGAKYNRAEPTDNKIVGEKSGVRFSPKDKVESEFVVLESDDVQQSHMKGQPNLNFFLGQAQPKSRGQGEFMAKTGQLKAQNLDPEALGFSPNAYYGAPIVNNRGEVIQGNGRTEAIKIAYSEYQSNAAEYKQYLIDNAAKFGLDPNAIAKMKNPMLVRQAKVSDAEAIRLGQYQSAELEDSGGAKTEARGRVRRLTPEQLDKLMGAFEGQIDTTKSLRDLLRNIKIMRVMRDVGVITNQEFSDGVSGNTVKRELVQRGVEFFNQLVLEGSIPELATELDSIPSFINDGIDAATRSLLTVSEEKNILPDLHIAILGAREYQEWKKLNGGAANYTFDMWKKSPTLTTPAPNTRYTPVELELIKYLMDTAPEIAKNSKDSRAKVIADFFKQYQELTLPKEGDMFSDYDSGKTKVEAINEILGTDINEEENVKREREVGRIDDETEGAPIGQEESAETETRTEETEQPITTQQELEVNRDEAEGAIIDTVDGPELFDELVSEGKDPVVSMHDVIDMQDQFGSTDIVDNLTEEVVEEKIIRGKNTEGISSDAAKVEIEISKEGIDKKEVERQAEKNDELIDDAILPEELSTDIINQLHQAKLIDEDTMFYAKLHLTAPNDITQDYYQEALETLPAYKESLKTSKKEKAKKGTKKTKPKKAKVKTEKPKTKTEKKSNLDKNLEKSKKELEDLLKGLKGPGNIQMAGVTPRDIKKAAIKYGYFSMEKIAEINAATPENISKSTWKKGMLDTFGSIMDPFLDQIWEMPVPPSVNKDTPILSDHAANLRKIAKAAIKADDFEAGIPKGKQGKPKVDKRTGSERPPIVYQNYEKLPKSVDEYVAEPTYGTNLDKHQRYAVNMALTNFLTNKEKGFFLADSMGVGKTRILIATALEHAKQTGKPVLIVTQNQQIIDTAFFPDAVAMGVDLKDSNIKLITYTKLKNEVGNKYGLVIYDEAHNLKNPSKTFEASGEIMSDNVMHSTATPGDKIGNAVYFLSALLDVSREDMMAELGIKKVEGSWETNGNKSEKEAVELIDEYISKAFEQGKIIRREYPYWGTINDDIVAIDSAQSEEIDGIRMAYDEQIDKVRPGNYFDAKSGEMKYTPGRRKWDKAYTGLSEESANALDDKITRGLREQKINMLDKVIETYKVKATVIRIKNDLAQGKAVVVTSQNVNEITVKGLLGKMENKQKRQSFLQDLKDALKAAKIPFAEITGKTDKTKAVEEFQNGTVDVVIGSMQSMSTGISLDDVTGDKPRVLYNASSSYDANVFNQVQGRVSRRNSKTPAETNNIYANTPSEETKMGKVQKKTGILGVFQGYGLDEATRKELDESDSLRKSKPIEKKIPFVEVYDGGDSITKGEFILVKDSYDIKNILKGLGAKPYYKWEPLPNGKNKKNFLGWKFPIKRKAEIEDIVKKYNEGTLELATLQKARAQFQFSQTVGTTPNRTVHASSSSTYGGGYTRIDVMPISGGEKRTLREVLSNIRKKLKVFAKYGRPIGATKAVLGAYNSINSAIQTGTPNDIDTMVHEVGHYLDDKFKIAPNNDSLDATMAQFWEFGSMPTKDNPNPQKYMRAEAIAEYVRALIYNPAEAKLRSPELYDLVMNKLPDDIKLALDEISIDVRALHGLDINDKFSATMQESKLDKEARNTFWQNRKMWWDDMLKRHKIKTNEMGNFALNWWDDMTRKWGDQLAPFKKSMLHLQQINGVKDLLAEDNPYILARLFAGMGSKIDNIIKKGAVMFKQGKGYMRMIDSKTKEAITVDWLLQPVETVIDSDLWPKKGKGKGFKSKNVALRDFKDYVGNYMVAERTLELADRFDRDDVLTGVGIGMTDVAAAKEFLDKFDKQADGFKQQVQEASRRYRVFADSLLRYMLDHGRISQEQVDLIKSTNLQYVAMQRVQDMQPGEEFDFISKSGGGQYSLEQAVKGSKRDRFDPYENLMTNLYKIVQETDKNHVYDTFVDMMRSNRPLYDGDVTPTAEIGMRIAVSPGSTMDLGKNNIIIVYNEGVKEYWELHEDVYKSLASMTESTPISEAWKAAMTITNAYTKLIRTMVTKNPVFAYLRNLPRDIQARLVQSRTMTWPDNGKSAQEMREAYIKLGMDPNDVDAILKQMDAMTNKEYLSMFEVYGGDQAGYYTKSREHYYAAMDKAIRKIASNGNAIMDVKGIYSLFDKYDDFLSKGERATRLAEYKSAYKYAKKKLMYDDYNASLYAAFQARDLMDFAVAGSYMKVINQIVPFSNASMQGTLRTLKGIAEDYNQGGLKGVAKNTGLRWLLVNAAPHIFFIALAKALGYEDEYKDLPAYQKDMFFSFKIPALSSGVWITIPKPFELGITGTAFERLYYAAQDGDFEKHFQGYAGSLYRAAIPFEWKDIMSFTKPLFEAQSNYSSFYQSQIIPSYEENVALDMRKGKGNASYIGQILGDFIETDPRKVDYVIKNWFSYFGDFTMKASNYFEPEVEGEEDSKPPKLLGLEMLGIFKDSAPTKTRSVQSMFKDMKDYKLWGTDDGKQLKKLLAQAGDYDTEEGKESYKKTVLEFSLRIEKAWRENVPIYKKFLRGEDVVVRGVTYNKKYKNKPAKRLRKALFNN